MARLVILKERASKRGQTMQDEVLYDTQVIGFLEEIWGDGFLSPGGPQEVAKVLSLSLIHI